jgi:hypothetical protein
MTMDDKELVWRICDGALTLCDGDCANCGWDGEYEED